MMLELVPASDFTLEQLTDLYNQTRVDYLVPMPMNVGRLAEYIRDFDVNLDYSTVARASDDGQVLGLIMMGVRANVAWVTRLGVLPVTRRGGVGAALMNALLQRAEALGLPETHLEVIKNNTPAYQLFLKNGFVETGEYLVMRRAPHAVSSPSPVAAEWAGREQALAWLKTYPEHLTWINALSSFENAPDVEGMQVVLPSGAWGWLVYRVQRFSLSHLVLHTVQGDPLEVGMHMLANLHMRYPRHDTYAENIYQRDPHLSALFGMGYFENFLRIEMRRKNIEKQ